MSSRPAEEIERYLRTGEHDPCYTAWSGGIIDRARRGDRELRAALLGKTRRLTNGITLPPTLPNIDLVPFTRNKLQPMVDGLFPARERELMLSLLEKSVVFVTPANIEQVLSRTNWVHTAWDLANLYLTSIGAELLGQDATEILGLSEETTCYVSLAYFSSTERFADFVVHEAAHVFHNCKRHTVGLHETRTREWLLDIQYDKRETFAYACEALSRILELARSPSDRRALLVELEEGPMPQDERVEACEYVAILREAIGARNGWKRILGRCAPSKRSRGR